MSRVVFSISARLDRKEISLYTLERFGIEQTRRLRRQFQVTLERLAESPSIGRADSELDPPGRSFRYFVVLRRFIVVYELAADGSRVARVLHGARNLAAELDRDTGDDD